MRLTLAAIVLAFFPAVAAAQVTIPSVGSTPIPLPTIGTPLPPIGLPLPPIGLTPPVTTPPIGARRPQQPRFVFLYPIFYDWNYPPYPGMPTDARRQRREKEEPRSGPLRIEVQPEKLLQVFINGYFIGTPEDFDRELELPLGTHTVELTAPGYEAVKFEVKIDGTRPITYRGELKPLDAKPSTEPPPPVPQAPPSTLYYIPGCYLGNVDPKDVPLPANCDLSKLVTKPPTPR